MYGHICVYSRACTPMWLSSVLVLCGLQLSRSAITTVDLFSMCSDERDPDYMIPKEDTIVVIINGTKWPAGATRCPVIFYSYGNYDDVVYEFKSFSVSDKNTRVALRDAGLIRFAVVADYSLNNTAPIGEPRETNMHLKIRPERLNLADESLFAIIELRNQDWIQELNRTRHQKAQTNEGSSAVDRFPGGVLIGACVCIALVLISWFRG